VALNEVAPPGFGHTKGDKKKGVEKGGTAAAFDRARKEGRFKGSKSDMFAIMWSQKKKGDKPHYKPGTDNKYKKYQKEELTGDMKTDLEKHRVPRGPGGNPIRIGDKVRSMSEKQPLGKLKIKYGADKVRDYYKKNKAVDEEVQVNEGGYHTVDGKYDGKKVSGKFLKLPRKVAKGVKRDSDERHELGKVKDAVTDTLGITNTKRDGVRKHDGIKGAFQMQNSYEPEGEVVEAMVQGGISMQEYDPNMKFRDYEFIDVIKAEPLKKTIEESYTETKAKERQKFVDFYKKAKASKAKKQSDAVRSDSKKHGIKFTDSRGSGRMRGGRKHYD